MLDFDRSFGYIVKMKLTQKPALGTGFTGLSSYTANRIPRAILSQKSVVIICSAAC